MINAAFIQYLSEVALVDYRRKKMHPDLHALIAAQAIATEVASQKNAESANAVAFESAMAAIVNLAKYSASHAASVNQMQGVTRQYIQRPSQEGSPQVLTPDFNALVNQLESFVTEHDKRNASAMASFHAAKQAASSIFPHAYACARVAYTHAIGVAARASNEERDTLFKTAFVKKFSADFLAQSLEPSFLMQLFCSDAVQVMSTTLLVLGLVALALGVGSLLVAPLGLWLITNLSLTSTALMVTGGATTATSVGLYVGRFFATTSQLNEQEKGLQAVNAMNGVEINPMSSSPGF